MQPSSSSSSESHWSILPVEIQLAITHHLDIKTLLSLSLVSRRNYTLCLPAIYNSVTLSSLVRLQRFLDHVPVDHALHIRALDVSTAGDSPTQAACSDALGRILDLTPRLRSLSLHLSTDLSHQILPWSLAEMRSIPHYTWRISPHGTRSCTTTDLDTDPDDSPCLTTVATAATLPNLLSIPSLRHLAIHNTFLGNPLFASADLAVQCQLESLEIGAFENASPTENARWGTQILQRVGSHLRSLVLSSGIVSTTTEQQQQRFSLSLPSLERVRLTPIFSPSHLPSTLRMLATATATTASGCLRHIHVECLTVDLEDVCEELSECVEHVNGGPYNLKLRVFPALECDVLTVERPVTSDCLPPLPLLPLPLPVHSLLDENAQDALSRLEDAFTSAGTPISIMGSNLLQQQQEDEEQDWDDLTVVDETAVGMEMKGTVVMEEPWAQVGIW
ncbi:hypothetical protein F5888DRAFT_1892011 [Russula emetica]|nr:hypothetical protein F5888DRAFT_1892011 [Russula emetica]